MAGDLSVIFAAALMKQSVTAFPVALKRCILL